MIEPRVLPDHEALSRQAAAWLADQLRVFDIITTDARHFRDYRTPSGRALRNLI